MVKPKWYYPQNIVDDGVKRLNHIIRFEIEVKTIREDSPAEIAHALGNEIVNHLTMEELVPCRINSTTVDGSNIYKVRKRTK